MSQMFDFMHVFDGAAGPPSECWCGPLVALTYASEGETCAVVNPGGSAQSPVGSTPLTPEEVQRTIANPQEG